MATKEASAKQRFIEQLLHVGALGAWWKAVNEVWSCLWASICWLVQSRNTLGIPWRSEVILESRKIKSATVSTFSPSVCHEVMGLDALILAFFTRMET